MNKKYVFALAAFSMLSITACAKSNTKSAKKTESAAKEPALPEQNADIEKAKSILNGMSNRFKDDVRIENLEVFIADLKKILATKNDFSSTDLSPFYLIDKTHTVGSNYVPENLVHLESNSNYKVNKDNLNLRPEAFDALNKMGNAAKTDGVTLTVSSTYRSYEYQKNLFDYWVRVDGLEEAERESARPGTSQHQLGLALDFAPVDDAFDKTPGGKWVYENAANYGWSLSFPQGYEDVTGYRWECWHFRYVGVQACQFQKKYFNNVQQYMIEFIDAWENWKF